MSLEVKPWDSVLSIETHPIYIIQIFSNLKKVINCIELKTMKRDKAIDAINELPKEFELDALLEKLVFVEKVEQGLAQLKNGKTVTHTKVKETVKS